MPRLLAVCFLVTTSILISTASAQSPGVISVLLDGSPGPAGQSMSNIRSPLAVNDNGTILFQAGLDNSDPNAASLVLFNGTSFKAIAKQGEASPDGGRGFLRFEQPFLNNSDQVAFTGIVPGGTGDGGFSAFFHDGTSLNSIASLGQPVPGSGGTYHSSSITGLNDAGQMLVLSTVAGVPDTTFGTTGTFLSIGSASALGIVARTGDESPDGAGKFRFLSGGELTNDSTYYFLGDFSDGSFNLLLGDGETLTPLFQPGDVAPDGDGQLDNFRALKMNEAGQLAFRSRLVGPTLDPTNPEAYFLSENGSARALLETGQPGPFPNSTVASFVQRDSATRFNDAGELAVEAMLDIGTREVESILLTDGDEIDLVARAGRLMPNGVDRFERLSIRAFNQAGQLIFSNANFSDARVSAIFFHDEHLGILEVASVGSSFRGSTFTDVSVGEGLTEEGNVWYRFELADGRSGLAQWSAFAVPEPATLLLASIAIVVGGLTRRPRFASASANGDSAAQSGATRRGRIAAV